MSSRTAPTKLSPMSSLYNSTTSVKRTISLSKYIALLYCGYKFDINSLKYVVIEK